MVVKLTYFPMTGLGEPIRLLLAATKTEFEDIRIGKEEWQRLKPTLKMPHLPMLEMDGKTHFQTMAICRYLARKAGLCGSSEEEALECDKTVDTLEDFRRNTVTPYYQPDSEQRDKALKNALDVTMPPSLKLLEKQLEENNGYLVAGKVTWADIIFFSHVDYITSLFHTDIIANFPKLKELQQKISVLPGIKEWLQKRPPHPEDTRALFF